MGEHQSYQGQADEEQERAHCQQGCVCPGKEERLDQGCASRAQGSWYQGIHTREEGKCTLQEGAGPLQELESRRNNPYFKMRVVDMSPVNRRQTSVLPGGHCY